MIKKENTKVLFIIIVIMGILCYDIVGILIYLVDLLYPQKYFTLAFTRGLSRSNGLDLVVDWKFQNLIKNRGLSTKVNTSSMKT